MENNEDGNRDGTPDEGNKETGNDEGTTSGKEDGLDAKTLKAIEDTISKQLSSFKESLKKRTNERDEKATKQTPHKSGDTRSDADLIKMFMDVSSLSSTLEKLDDEDREFLDELDASPGDKLKLAKRLLSVKAKNGGGTNPPLSGKEVDDKPNRGKPEGSAPNYRSKREVQLAKTKDPKGYEAWWKANPSAYNQLPSI